VFRRLAFLQAGGSERYFQKLACNGGPFLDHYTVARLSALGPCFASSERLGFYRIHPQQISSNLVWGKTLRSADHFIDTYDAIFFDKDIFSSLYRYLAKVNEMGRIMTDNGILNTARSMLDSHRLGPALNAAKRVRVNKSNCNFGKRRKQSQTKVSPCLWRCS